MQDGLMLNLIVLILTLFTASVLDLRYRKVSVYIWIPAAITILITSYYYYLSLPLDLAIPQFIWCCFFAFVGFAFVALRFYGGADGIAVMLIAFAFPVNPLTGHMQFIVLHIFVIACAITVIWSLMNLWKNLNSGRSGTIEKLMFALPVPVDRLQSVKGWLYHITNADGDKLYTDSMTEQDIDLIKDQKEVWIVLAMPFMVPLFVGLLMAVFLA
jgi:hypothetical protein